MKCMRMEESVMRVSAAGYSFYFNMMEVENNFVTEPGSNNSSVVF